MRIRWYNGALLIKADTKPEHELMVKIYDVLEGLEFGREVESGKIGDSDDIELVASNK